MKILFQSRTDLFTKRGGDTVQIEYTKKYIEELYTNVKVDISTKVEEPNINNYDIVNLFNIDWIPETYAQAQWAKKHKKLLVVNAIHHSYKDLERFEKFCRYDYRRLTNLIVRKQEHLDMLKNVAKSTVFMKFDKFKPTMLQLKKGIRNQQREIINMADMIITQTDAEYESIKEDFNVSDFNYKKVVSGVNVDLFGFVDDSEFRGYMSTHYDVSTGEHGLVLNVGRIEPRKNQINLIKAFRELKNSSDDHRISNLILVFIGGKNKLSPEYLFRFDNLVKKYDDIFYLGRQSQKFVASAMASNSNPGSTNFSSQHITTSRGGADKKLNSQKKNKINRNNNVYVQTSWFETLGLVSLEAALSGMHVVASGDRIKEYLKDYARYCDVADVKSIKDAIASVLDQPVNSNKNNEYLNEFRDLYTWQNTAKQTIAVYNDLMQNKTDD